MFAIPILGEQVSESQVETVTNSPGLLSPHFIHRKTEAFLRTHQEFNFPPATPLLALTFQPKPWAPAHLGGEGRQSSQLG